MKNAAHSHSFQNYFLLFSLFFLSVFIRFYFSSFLKIIEFYPDELRYYQIAENLINGRGILLYNLPTDYQKIFYSLLIAPAFLFENREIQQQIIVLINSFLLSSSIFPAYFFAKKFLNQNISVVIILLLTVILPDISYSLTFMSENAFVPLSLWLFYFFIFFIYNIESFKPFYSLFLGFFCYILYLCKEVAAIFPLVLLVYLSFSYYFKWIICFKNPFKNILILFSTFLICFVVVKYSLFFGLGNSYEQSSIDVLFKSGRFSFLIYSFFYYLSNLFIAVLILPLLFPLIYFKSLSIEKQKMFVYLFLLLIGTAMVVAYTISIREDFESTLPRLHLRYFAYAWIPLFVLFMSFFENQNSYYCLNNNKILFVLIVLSLFLIYPGTYSYYPDQTFLIYLLPSSESLLKDSAYLQILLTFKIALFLFVVYFYFKGKSPKIYFLFLFVFSLIQIYNNFKLYHFYYSRSKLQDVIKNEVFHLENFIKNNPQKTFLFFGDIYLTHQRIADTFYNYPNVKTLQRQGILKMQKEGKIILPHKEIPSLIYGFFPKKSGAKKELKETYFVEKADFIISIPIFKMQFDNTILREDLSGSVYSVFENKHIFEIPTIQIKK